MKLFHINSLKKFAIALAMLVVVAATGETVLPAFAKAPTQSANDIEGAMGLDKVKPQSILSNVADIVGNYVAKGVGVLLGIFAVYKLIVALKDQDSNGSTNAAVQLAIAITLLFLRPLITLAFGI